MIVSSGTSHLERQNRTTDDNNHARRRLLLPRQSFTIHVKSLDSVESTTSDDNKRRVRHASSLSFVSSGGCGGGGSQLLFIGTTIISIAIIVIVIILQLRAYIVEYQGPLDHVASSLLRPYYGTFCPVFSSIVDDAGGGGGVYYHGSNESTSRLNSTVTPSWDCHCRNNINIDKERNPTDDANGKAFETTTTTSFPRIFMIGARTEDEDTFRAWDLELHRITANYSHDDGDGGTTSRRLPPPRIERINTLDISNRYALSGGAPLLGRRSAVINDNRSNSTSTSTMAIAARGSSNTMMPVEENGGGSNRRKYANSCRRIKWEHRLFAVYQSIFADLLLTYPTDTGFVIVEDDAILKNTHLFFREVCDAQRYELEFYSLYRSPLQHFRGWTRGGYSPPSCVYLHGTVAFYVRRSIMETIVNERRRAYFCRFPIDMYISKLGPWYSTRKEIVGHSSVGRIGSTARGET